MAVFIASACVLTLATFAWVLRPLWRVRALPVLVAGGVLGASVALLYSLVGTPAALDPAQRALPKTMDEAVARLESELQRDPNQVDGLRLLARAYASRGEVAKSRDTYQRALKLAPDDADLLAEAAETSAQTDPQRRFSDAAIAQLRQALRVQPMHQRARWFLGIALRQQGRHAEAASAWEPLLAVVDAKTAVALRPQIDAARQDAGLPPLPAATVAEQAEQAAAGVHAIEVQVTVEPELAQRMPGASVFVIARVPGGPPMPVAVEKHRIKAIPARIVLDDGDSPMPTQTLSALPEVEVLARISASGNAMRQDGDIESTPVRVKLPAQKALTFSLKD